MCGPIDHDNVRMPESQFAIVDRALKGQATAEDLSLVQANFERWVQLDFAGDEALALAYSVNALADACATDWAALSERHRSAHIWLFTLLCPDKSRVDQAALAYLSWIDHDLARSAEIVLELRGD